MILVGIDPGKKGGLVALSPQPAAHFDVVAAHRAEEAYCPRGEEYRPKEMAHILRSVCEGRPSLLILERQHAMPKQGGTSMLVIGRGFGLWEGIAAALSIPVEVVSASTWQREIFRGVPGEGKQRAVHAVERRIPSLELCPGKVRKPHLGLADAGCLALFGISRWRSQEGRS